MSIILKLIIHTVLIIIGVWVIKLVIELVRGAREGWKKGMEQIPLLERLAIALSCPFRYMQMNLEIEKPFILLEHYKEFLTDWNEGAGCVEVWNLNTMCNFDPDIVPYLNAPYGSTFKRDESGQFQMEDVEEEALNADNRWGSVAEGEYPI